jgi:LysM repeat protein
MTQGPSDLPPGFLTGQSAPPPNVVQNGSYSVAYVQTVNSYADTSNEYTIPANRYWLSVPRPMNSDFWDVLLINFRVPVSVTGISFDLYEVAQHWEFWCYPNDPQRPTGNGVFFPDATTRIPILDRSLRHLEGQMETGRVGNWYHYDFKINQTVLRTLEMRIQRINDGIVDPNALFSIGVRNLLCKREVYNENDAMIPLEPGVDPMGNIVESYVRKWDPIQATDGDSFTYWKSSPQPSPEAVVPFYMDVRDDNGKAQRIDRLFLDPYSSGQALNMYYSTDDTVGPRRLQLTRVTPTSQVDTNWVETVGIDFSATTAFYEFATSTFNIDITQSVWIAGAWIPTFSSTSGPANTLTLLCDPDDHFHLRYLPLLQEFEIKWGAYTGRCATDVFSASEAVNFSIRLVQANSAGVVPGIYFQALNPRGVTISAAVSVALPDSTTPFPSLIDMKYSQGYMNKLFIKQDAPTQSEVVNALNDLQTYLLPNVPQEDATTNSFAVDSLTDMVYGADFAMNELGWGGTDHLFFTEKVWSPIWVDWTSERAMYYFPVPVVAKYLKLEFTGLTPEPYTIHAAGITVQYASFPISVTEINSNSYNSTTTYTSTENKSVVNGRVLSDNYYNSAQTTTSSSNSVPVYFISVGSPEMSTTPRSFDSPLVSALTSENHTSVFNAIYATSSTSTIAADAYYTVVSGDWLIKIGKKYNIPWQEIYNVNRGMVDNDPRVDMLPSRSPGWWIFPGQQLRIPNAIMETITNTSTTTEKTVSNTTISTRRNRFTKTEVHRYEYRTAERDAAIGYFCGIREVQAFTIDYTVEQDTEVYDFPIYDTNNFVFTNMYEYAYSGGWESTADPVEIAAIYPDTQLYPTKTFYPQAPSAYYPESEATWGAPAFEWGDTHSDWGYEPGVINGQIVSKTFNSLSNVQSVALTVYDRGLYHQIDGTEMSVIGLGTSAVPGGEWDDAVIDWGDSVAVWGSQQALVSATFYGDITYANQSAAQLNRPAGTGVAGIGSPIFQVVPHARVRVSLEYYRPVMTDNAMILQLVDMSQAPTERIVFQETMHQTVAGAWTTYRTAFYTVGNIELQAAQVRVMVQGSEAETLYVGRVYPDTTTILYELSNDGGKNYYEATQVAYGSGSRSDMVFPTLDRNVRLRVTLWDPAADFVFGASLTPRYV